MKYFRGIEPVLLSFKRLIVIREEGYYKLNCNPTLA